MLSLAGGGCYSINCRRGGGGSGYSLALLPDLPILAPKMPSPDGMVILTIGKRT
jgi:hypothetical protein